MSTNFKPVPSTRDLIAARQAQAPTAAPAVYNKPVAEARAEYNASYRSRYLSEVAPAGGAGVRIKFSKDGEYVTSDGQPLPKGAEYILLAEETLIAWIKFGAPGEPPERQAGLLYDGFMLPARASLGDLDPNAWEQGLNGQPVDPWQHEMSLVLQDTNTAELYTFTTTSKTGRIACGKLLQHFDRMQRARPGELPVVRLSKGGFKHKDSRVGWVDVPLFTVVRSVPRDGAVKSTQVELNDPISF